MAYQSEPVSAAVQAAAWATNKMPTFIERLQQLVCIDTGYDCSVGRDTAAAKIADWARALGCEVELIPGSSGANVVASLSGRGRGRVVLVCHHDTVFPVGTAQTRPFEVRGDRAFGPGVADMKGGIALALMALERLGEGDRPFASVELHCVPDEEIRTKAFETVELARGADAALVLECGRQNGDLVIARKAGCWLRLKASGRPAHAGTHPEEGRSAVLALCSEVQRCSGLNGAREGLTVIAGTVSGGTMPNVVPELAEAVFDIRALRNCDMDWVVGEMAAHGCFDGVTVALERAEAWPAIEPTPSGSKLFEQAVLLAQTMGSPIGGQMSGGQSDGNWCAQAGIPTLDGLGPVGGQDHSPEEYLLLTSVPGRCGLLTGLVESVGKGLLDTALKEVAIE